MKIRGKRLHRIEILGIALFASALALTTARAIGIEDVVDGGNTYAWQEVALPGTICGNGSQYRFYYYDSPTSNNMLMLFEGGGACWDYDTCSGRAGILGAAHPNGIPTNYIQEFQPKYVSPLVERRGPRHSRTRQEGSRDQGLRHGLHAVLHGRRAHRQRRRHLRGSDRREPAAHLAAQRLQQHECGARTTCAPASRASTSCS